MKKSVAKTKKMKAWAVADSAGDPLQIGAGFGVAITEIYCIYNSESTAKKAWSGFNVIPIEITLPAQRRKG